MSEPYTIFDNGWIYRIRKPEHSYSNQVILLVHGWTGNENSMWAFAHLFPKEAWLIAPRGLIQAAPGMYGWVNTDFSDLSQIDEFLRPAEVFREHATALLNTLNIHSPKVNLVGFSQGAALIYTLLLQFPEWAQKSACMSGFLPINIEKKPNFYQLSRSNVLITHGLQDEVIPVSEAHRAETTLTSTGANVHLATDSSGHKLGAYASRAVKAFFLF